MANYLQKLVSKKKRRMQEDGFDLDMTFITRNVVAMGFPAEKIEGVYRNKMSDVKKYFDSKFKDHYKVYNLCSERGYDPSKFYGRVANYPFDDHNAPPFVLIEPFCADVYQYLAKDEGNVVVIHCKAGKGRTGVMICAFLLHSAMWEDTQDALDYYGHTRTKNGKGVTIPSQIRYVHYYGKYTREKLHYSPTTLIFKSVKLQGIPNIHAGTCAPQFTIRQGPDKVLIFKSQVYEGILKDQKEAVLQLDPPTPVCGDIKVEFFHRKSAGKEKMFHLWFNTFFIEDNKLIVKKKEVDKANKDKKHKIYPAEFTLELTFHSPDHIASRRPAPNAAAGSTPAHTPGKEERPSMTGASGTTPNQSKMRHQDSTVSQEPEWSDSDLTTDDEEDEDEWEGLPISDV